MPLEFKCHTCGAETPFAYGDGMKVYCQQCCLRHEPVFVHETRSIECVSCGLPMPERAEEFRGMSVVELLKPVKVTY